MNVYQLQQIASCSQHMWRLLTTIPAFGLLSCAKGEQKAAKSTFAWLGPTKWSWGPLFSVVDYPISYGVEYPTECVNDNGPGKTFTCLNDAIGNCIDWIDDHEEEFPHSECLYRVGGFTWLYGSRYIHIVPGWCRHPDLFGSFGKICATYDKEWTRKNESPQEYRFEWKTPTTQFGSDPKLKSVSL